MRMKKGQKDEKEETETGPLFKSFYTVGII